jgi:hypothetical protein
LYCARGVVGRTERIGSRRRRERGRDEIVLAEPVRLLVFDRVVADEAEANLLARHLVVADYVAPLLAREAEELVRQLGHLP